MLVNETKTRTCAANQPSDQQITPADDIAISVKNLTKTYRIFGHPSDRIMQFLNLGFECYHWEFTALKKISFDSGKASPLASLAFSSRVRRSTGKIVGHD